MRTTPLAGLRVVEIGQAVAAPLAGVILADLGAEVIKVEKPDGGDDARLWGPPWVGETGLSFHAYNRGKRGVTLDLKSSADVAQLRRLAQDADILIQNLRPGVVEELGIGPEAMLAANPRLIYCSIWAFGYAGPLRLAPGFDPLLQAYGAMMSVTGGPDDPPTFAGAAINDKSTAMWCVIGALAALRQRDATGEGCVVDTSLFESAVALVETPLNGYLASGEVPPRHGTGSPNLVPYQLFQTADRPVCIAAGNQRLWVKFAGAVGHPEWAEDPRFRTGRDRTANRSALVEAIRPVLLAKGREHWVAAFTAAGVPCAPVNDLAELAATPQLAAMDLLRQVPGTDLRIVGLPVSLNHERPAPRAAAPSLGQDNADILGKAAPN
ncbi:CaiB/BaiF CoA transferase family protein [Belnapia moabensis]|uniref:CaiB/BaiF CoA transferase family protein n=1 Tax=Belnapia moabensis TaxID=365533 RepID=UPI0005BCAA2E|nr:CoA transferase [Belnapia moabensis]